MKVSVCMATYNGEDYLKEQLDSILKQLSKEDELIISDDGSSDRTLSIIKSYNDKRVRLVHSNRRNLIFNFENALKSADGDVIFLSDQDDIWFDEKVERIKEQLKYNTLVFSNALVFDGENQKESRLMYSGKNRTGFFKNLLKNNYIGASMAFRREILDVALPFPQSIPMHDIWLALLAEAKGKTHYVHEPLIYYRRHDDNASSTGAKSKNSIWTKFKYRLVLFTLICKRIWLKK